MDLTKTQLFFEDLDVGYTTPLSGGRTVTETDIVNFAGFQATIIRFNGCRVCKNG